MQAFITGPCFYKRERVFCVVIRIEVFFIVLNVLKFVLVDCGSEMIFGVHFQIVIKCNKMEIKTRQ